MCVHTPLHLAAVLGHAHLNRSFFFVCELFTRKNKTPLILFPLDGRRDSRVPARLLQRPQRTNQHESAFQKFETSIWGADICTEFDYRAETAAVGFHRNTCTNAAKYTNARAWTRCAQFLIPECIYFRHTIKEFFYGYSLLNWARTRTYPFQIYTTKRF